MIEEKDPMDGYFDGLNDTGEHYRFSYKGINIDPARICSIYKTENVLQGAIVKKTLMAGKRGHNTIIEDIDDVIIAALRWKQMVLEDQNDNS